MTLTVMGADDNDFNRQLAELDKIQDTCKKLLATKHYANLGEAGIHAIMARAKALGLHPFEALNGGFHCINGKVGMSTEMMAALVRRKGHSITKDPKSNGESVILHGKRADNGDTWTCTFTKDDAIAAGLWNTATWKKYPAVMLYNRCMSMLFRQLFPDLSLGAGYVEDELKEITKTGDYAKELQVVENENVTYEIEHKKEEVDPKKLPITLEQYETLNDLIGQHDDVRAEIMEGLQARGIYDLKQMPASWYKKACAIAKAAERLREEEKAISVAEIQTMKMEGSIND